MRRLIALITIIVMSLGVAACDAVTSPRTLEHRPMTDPVGAAALLPPSVRLALPGDSVRVGDTLVASAVAFDFSGKIQNQARVVWFTQAVDTAPGAVSITPLNPKGQQVTIRGLARGRLRVIVTYVDRYGQAARDSGMLRVSPRTANVGICLLDPRVADSLGINGDTTVDYGIVGQFCIQNDTIWIRTPSDTSGADTTKVPPPSGNVIASGFNLLLDAKAQVRVHVLRPKGVHLR